jgi:hypothetical protein
MGRYARGMTMVVLLSMMVVPLAVLAGCGSSENARSAQQKVPNRLQLQLGGDAQRQLRARLHDSRLSVRAVTCERGTSAGTECVLRVRDGRGHGGTVTIRVTIDPKKHSAQARFTSTSSTRWAKALGSK